MNTIRFIICLSFLSSGTTYAYDFQTIAVNHILPAYQKVSDETDALHHSVGEYCSKPADKRQEEMRHHFRKAFLAWQGTQHIRTGPVQYLSREHRFSLWPDKRGTVSKHLSKLLEDKDLESETFKLSKKSVAVQGFTALERLLFQADPVNGQQCKVMVVIADNLRTMSAGIVSNWAEGENAFINDFSKPSEINPIYQTDKELAGVLLNGFHTELEFLVTVKLQRLIGKEETPINVKRTEGWRSETTLPAITENLKACESIFRTVFLPEISDGQLKKGILDRFSTGIKKLESIKRPLQAALGEPGFRSEMLKIQAIISELKKLTGQEMAKQLELSLGFNSLDGD